MSEWLLVFDSFEPEREGHREALCTLGNGYVCMRGAAAESQADGTHYPATYLAGGYNRLSTNIAGREVENEDLVNFPHSFSLSFRIADSVWFDLRDVKVLSYRQELDLAQGMLLRRVRFKDSEGRICKLTQRRLVSIVDKHIAVQETTLVAENWSGVVEFRIRLDGQVVNDNVARYRELNNAHLKTLHTEAPDEQSLYLKVQTRQSLLHMAQAVRTRFFIGDSQQHIQRTSLDKEQDRIAGIYCVTATPDCPIRIENTLAIFTSRDTAISECGIAARQGIECVPGFAQRLKDHARAWQHLWQRFDLEIDGNQSVEVQRIRMTLRLHIFHLLQTASLLTIGLDVGVPARGWHGEAYRGHIFWDELFIFPLFNLRMPEITRALLMYRYRRLDAARDAARKAGFSGAMYPWQSGSDGREETQKVHLNPESGNWLPDNSHRQRHVNAAIAWNIWQYFQVTGDLEFLSFYGAEMFLEIARFWASLCTWSDEHWRYEILGVMGPDEYHDGYPDDPQPEGLNNNAYTNVMAVWVLMLFYLFSSEELHEIFERLGYPFEYATIPRNIKYYHERTSHGSTLSQVVHAWVLSRSDREGSWELFKQALRADIDDIQGGTTAEGIHLGAMSGTLDLIQRGYTGIETRGGMLRFNPCLPRGLSYLRMRLRYRGQSLEMVLTPERLHLNCRECAAKPIKVALGQKIAFIQGGGSLDFTLKNTTTS